MTLVTEHARALAVFDRFLAFSRAASAPAAAPTPPPPAPSVHPALTEVSTAVTPWEEPTRERPDVVRAMVQGGAAHPDTTPGILSPEVQTAVEERSIIVDDDTLTDPEFGRVLLHRMSEMLRPATAAAPEVMPVSQLVQEMSVLVKYGHAQQAAEETERWVSAHPDDFSAHLAIAEFELQQIDREAAVHRYAQLLSRLLERRELSAARDVARRLRDDVREDPQVAALVARVSAT
ncbi:MAG: hypothetical protein R3A48_20635 [Polyangiales bacterium]